MLHYLPGCDVSKNHPVASYKIQHYMKKRDAIFHQCCRVKETFLTSEDNIVTNCTLCDLMLNETHPDTKRISLYEYVLQDVHFPWVNHQGETITLQDCWRTRNDIILQKSVRQCLQKMNFTIIEMSENYEKTEYCGVWLYNQPAQECLELAPHTFYDIIDHYTHLLSEEEQLLCMKKWCKQYPTESIVVYCNGCEKGIRLGGKQPIHMIELLAEGLNENNGW